MLKQIIAIILVLLLIGGLILNMDTMGDFLENLVKVN